MMRCVTKLPAAFDMMLKTFEKVKSSCIMNPRGPEFSFLLGTYVFCILSRHNNRWQWLSVNNNCLISCCNNSSWRCVNNLNICCLSMIIYLYIDLWAHLWDIQVDTTHCPHIHICMYRLSYDRTVCIHHYRVHTRRCLIKQHVRQC